MVGRTEKTDEMKGPDSGLLPVSGDRRKALRELIQAGILQRKEKGKEETLHG